MRIATLILAILGALFSAALGAKWLSDASELKATIETLRDAGMGGEIDAILRAAYCLLVSAALGLAGGVMTMKGKGKPAAALFAVAVVLPAVFSGKTVLATAVFAIAVLLALVAKPKAKLAAAA